MGLYGVSLSNEKFLVNTVSSVIKVTDFIVYNGLK